MSHFSILRVDHYDPVIVGKRNRHLYTLYGILPGLTMVVLNILTMKSEHYGIVYLITFVTMLAAAILITVKTRRNNQKLKPVGEIEITKSGIKKNTGGVMAEYNYDTVRKITLTKHMPSTNAAQTKGFYFSYILRIESVDGEEDSFVVADRSLDNKQRISVLDTLKTLKKIVPFEVKIDV